MEKQYVTKGYLCPECSDKYESENFSANGFPSTCRSCHTRLPWEDCYWQCPNCNSYHEPDTETCGCGFNYKNHGL
jgi:hypothetical protein